MKITQLSQRPYTAWQLLRAYWQSEEYIGAYVFLLVVLVMTGALVGMDVLFTTWYNYFYNALQDYQSRDAIDLLAIFIFLASISIVLAVYRYYLQSFLGLRWRRWLTGQFLNRWLTKKNYYYLEEFNHETDNPDQRIQEDINSIVNLSLSLLVGFLSSIVTFFAFIYILWQLSGEIHLSFGSYGSVNIPGYLVWVAIIYAFLGTYCTFKIGRPLIGLNFEQQRREANFRFAAIDLRSHAEHIALYRGEAHQKGVLHHIFFKVLDNWYAIILRQKSLLWFTAGYNQVSVILPLVVALPNYFNKVFKLGGLMQTLSAFRNIQEALSFLVNSYTIIAEWQAVMRRLLTFLNHIYEIEHATINNHQFIYHPIMDNKIILQNVTIQTPQQDILLANINEELIAGHHYWIKGNSGIGKSTLVRAIARVWPFGSGEFFLPADKLIMFVPQRSYMPLGTLRSALFFPDQIMEVDDATLKQLLIDCDLPNLLNKLDYVTLWSDHLSPGELQRIAFLRVLLHRPDWVFLDESTSALDLAHEKSLYNLLKTRLPHCWLVSVGHRPSLETFHNRQIDIAQYRVMEVEKI